VYIFGLGVFFLFAVGGAYLKYLNYRQEKEAYRLGVRMLSRGKWTWIDDSDPRCTPELGHAYRLTNLLMTVNFTVATAIVIIMSEMTR
jgi:hypothetical protein